MKYSRSSLIRKNENEKKKTSYMSSKDTEWPIQQLGYIKGRVIVRRGFRTEQHFQLCGTHACYNEGTTAYR